MIPHILDAIWTITLLGGVPLQSLATRRTLEERHPSRMQIYASAIVTLVLLGLVTIGVDLSGARGGLAVVEMRLPLGSLALWTAVTFALGAALWFAFLVGQKLLGQKAEARLVAILPYTAIERFTWIGVSMVAGVAEEYVYRGFCLAFLTNSTGSLWLAGTLVTVGFGLAHAYQGGAATIKAGALGAVLLLPVLVTGALLPAIVAHAALDVLSGLTMRNLLRRWDLVQYGEWTDPR